MPTPTAIQVFEGDQHHTQIIAQLAEMFPDLGREAIYLNYMKMLAVLTAIDWPNEQQRILDEFEKHCGQTLPPYKRKVDISYENEDRPGEQIKIGVKDGKLQIHVKQADGIEGADWKAEVDPKDPENSKVETDL